MQAHHLLGLWTRGYLVIEHPSPSFPENSNRLSDMPGVYLDDCQVVDVAEYAKNPAKAEKLWDLSERLTGESFSW